MINDWFRFAVDQIEEPLSWRLQPQLHSPRWRNKKKCFTITSLRLRDEQVVLSTTRRYHHQEPPLPYHPPPPPPPPAPLYAQPRGYNRFYKTFVNSLQFWVFRWPHEGPRYRPDPVYSSAPNGHDPHLENSHRFH